MEALVNCRAHQNFIAKDIATKHGIMTKYHSKPYQLGTLGKASMGLVTWQVKAKLKVEQHEEQLYLDVADISGHDLVLGMPWLVKHNPTIN